MAEICAISTKPLPCRAFRLDGLITLTLKVVRSSRIGRTNPVMVSMAGFFCVKTISSKIVQGRFPHKLPLFIYYSMVVCVYRTKRQIAKRHSGFSRVLFEFVPQAAHRSFSLFTIQSSLAPNTPWPMATNRLAPDACRRVSARCRFALMW